MGNHHDHNDHHSNEKKPVAFTVPLIFASVVVLAIVLLVSLGDPKHGGCCCEEGTCSKECMDACKAGKCEMESCEKEKHGAHHGTEAKEDISHEENADTLAVSTTIPEATTDTTATKTEPKEHKEHKEEAHH